MTEGIPHVVVEGAPKIPVLTEQAREAAEQVFAEALKEGDFTQRAENKLVKGFRELTAVTSRTLPQLKDRAYGGTWSSQLRECETTKQEEVLKNATDKAIAAVAKAMAR